MKTNKLSLIGFIFGFISIEVGILGIPGLIISIIGRKQESEANAKSAFSLVGIICNCVGIVAVIVMVVLLATGALKGFIEGLGLPYYA